MLEHAFSIAEKVSIGITSEKLYILKPLVNLIMTASFRGKNVLEASAQNLLLGHANRPVEQFL